MTPEQQSTFRRNEDRKAYTTAVAIQMAGAIAAHADLTTPPEVIAKRAWDIADAVAAEREARGCTPSI